MTWKQLKNKITKLSEEQLKTPVCFQDNYGNLMGINFYIQKDEALINEEWETRVDQGMPKLGL